MKKIGFFIVLVLVAVGIAAWLQQEKSAPVAAPAPAQPVDVAAVRGRATAGDPVAQVEWGHILQQGNGVKRDPKEALAWFQKAADKGYPEAWVALGEMTQAGQAVKADPTEAARLYRLAAEQGSVAGQYDLAYLYEGGTGVERSETEAAKWYQLAAAGGDALAQYNMGMRYKDGAGVQADRTQAYKWLTLAAAQGQRDAVLALNALKTALSASELSAATRLVQEFVPRKPAAAKP